MKEGKVGKGRGGEGAAHGKRREEVVKGIEGERKRKENETKERKRMETD